MFGESHSKSRSNGTSIRTMDKELLVDTPAKAKNVEAHAGKNW